jgi:carbon monoxide dehydrogenase subunit G
MKISGSNVVPYPVEKVWDALLDPRVLVATIPGCERLETTGDHQYDMTVTAGVAAIKGTYAGSCALSDLAEHKSLVMRLQGAGAPGTIDATVDVAFEDLGAEGTRIDYQADAVVGGMVGGVGQRMLTSVSKRMAGEFFGNVGNALAAPAVPAGVGAGAAGEPVETTTATGAPVFTAPAKPAAVTSQDDLLKGIAVGAGLVLLGVIVGSVFGRRR